MTPEQVAEVRRVFEEALEVDPERRPEWLAQRVEGELRAEVERLLSGLDRATAILDKVGDSLVEASVATLAGHRAGPYELLEPIGHGGMGTVYCATRADDAFRKNVAVKLLGLQCGGPEMEAAFRRERQILASLEHPNIARLIDGGTTAEGLLYIVMELADGLPIDRFCAATNLSIDDRLALFEDVCAAVQYAHRNLIVHRDLKPSNILVTNDRQVKLLDFGIAKVLTESSGGPANATIPRMTPKYASPEQIQMQPITTATDVYSLGVVLYELLTGGIHPYETTSGSLRDTVTAICEQDPPRPSTVAEPGFRKELRGELDNLVLKAMAKRPADRYSSVEQLADDVRRYRAGLPVRVQGDAVFYRLRKFLRRQWALVAVATVLFLTLAGGVLATLHQAGIAERQRALAERRYHDIRSLATTILFGIHDSIRNLPGSSQARRLALDKSIEYLEALAKDPRRDPALDSELAASYERAGELMGSMFDSNTEGTRAAMPILEKALVLRQRVAADQPGDPNAAVALAMSYYRFGNGQFSAGLFKEAVASFERGVAVADGAGGDMQSRKTRATLQAQLCAVYSVTPRATQAVSFCSDVIRDLTGLLQQQPHDKELAYHLVWTQGQLGGALRIQGKPAEAIPHLRHSVERFREMIKADPNSARNRRALARVQLHLTMAVAASQTTLPLSAWRDAVATLEDALALDRSDHPIMTSLGYALQRYSAALRSHRQEQKGNAAYERALSVYRELVAKPQAGAVEMNDFANALVKCPIPRLQDAPLALRLSQRANELTERRNPLILDTLAWAYYRNGQVEEAIETARNALALLSSSSAGPQTGLRKDIAASLAEFQKKRQ